MHLRHCDTLTQVLISSSSTCPDGHAQNATSHNIGGLGLLQVALTGLQPPAKICPFPGHGTIVTFVIHDQTNSYCRKIWQCCNLPDWKISVFSEFYFGGSLAIV